MVDFLCHFRDTLTETGCLMNSPTSCILASVCTPTVKRAVAMPFTTKPVDLAVGRIESGKQSRAVEFVVVGHGLAATALQGQAGLGAIQGLDLALFVHAQHQRVFRRVQIQAHDVFHVFCKLGIVADLETRDPVRFQAVTAPDSTHAGVANFHGRRHAACAPVAGIRRVLRRVVMFTTRAQNWR